MRSRSVHLLLPLLCLLAGAVPQLAAGPTDRGARLPHASRRAIAIGDVHGDFETFRTLLRRLALIDSEDRWTGGALDLVQTGDVLDRGAGSRKAIELIMRLEAETRAAGGCVTMLLGNHEVMNLTGDLRFTTRGEFAAFAPDESPRLRARRREEILSLVRNGSPLLVSSYYAGLRPFIHPRSFDRVFPPGYFAHREAFSARGAIGKWLLERPVVHRLGATVFVHGGLSPRVARWSLDEINASFQRDLREFLGTLAELEERRVFDPALGLEELFRLIALERAAGPHAELEPLFTRLERLRDRSLVFAADGPVWYRGLAEEDEAAFRSSVDEILRLTRAERLVIGHTQPKSLRIEARFDGRVMLIDTGMNREAYGGRPSALLIEPGGSVEPFE